MSKKREKTFALMSTTFLKQQQHETKLKCFQLNFNFWNEMSCKKFFVHKSLNCGFIKSNDYSI